MTDEERASYWEGLAKEWEKKANFYQNELVKAHTMIGRIIQQFSERWDTVTITKYLFKETK